MTELIKSPDLNLRKTTLIKTTKSGVNYRINFNEYLKHHNLSEISQEQLKNNINNKISFIHLYSFFKCSK